MSSRLFVGNIAFHTTEDLLKQRFAAYGGVVSVSVVTDRDSGQSRGFAFVEMENVAAAQKAIAALDGQDLEGRTLRVQVAEDRKPGTRGPVDSVRDRGDRGGRRGR